VLAAIRDLTARHQPGDQIVVVTHGGPIWAYLRTLDTAQPVLAATATAPAAHLRPGLADNALDVANCSITHIHFPPDGPGVGVGCLLSLAQAGHLAGRVISDQ
jgi:broad specificity phosphatase PhoE